MPCRPFPRARVPLTEGYFALTFKIVGYKSIEKAHAKPVPPFGTVGLSLRTR